MPFRSVLIHVCALPILTLLGNPAYAGGFTNAASMSTIRSEAAATLLPSGKVLVAGGINLSIALKSAELYDPANNTWTSAAPMATARRDPTATLLRSGKVLVAGGGVATAELYDPSADTWTFTGNNMSTSRYKATATLLPSGKVLVAGGSSSASTDLYDPTSNTWTSAGNMPVALTSSTATLLHDSFGQVQVLVASGIFGGTQASSAAEIYHPSSNTWTLATHMGTARASATATLMDFGQVLVAGGDNNNGGSFSSTEGYDAFLNLPIWANLDSLTTARTHATATLLPNDQVLVTGGYDGSTALDSAELYDRVAGWSGAGTMSSKRLYQTATMLPTGRVLIVGGASNVSNPVSSSELYDPAVVAWSSTGIMKAARNHASATVLPSGKVLVAGGVGSSSVTASAELYDPSTGTWSYTGTMLAATFDQTATLLPSGKVLVVGGNDSTSTTTDFAELYDPASTTWTAAAPLLQARRLATATLLPSGKVLIAGGGDENGLNGMAQLYDPASDTWTLAGTLHIARAFHTATLLPSGKVLVAGGYSAPSPIAVSELYDPASNTWALTGSLETARLNLTATLLPSGKVLVAGGGDGSAADPAFTSAELYDPASGTWTYAGSMTDGRENQSAKLLPSGQVLVVGGITSNTGSYIGSAELYDPVSDAWTSAGTLITARTSTTATLLPTGKVLIAGGLNGITLASAELFDPGLTPVDTLLTPHTALRPVLSSAYISPTNQLIGTSPGSAIDSSISVTATGFMPTREGSGGSTNNSATNYPVFQVQRIDNGQMRFIPNDESVDFTDTTFTGAADAFSGFSPGPMLVRAWVNGVPSNAQYVELYASDVIFRDGFETTP